MVKAERIKYETDYIKQFQRQFLIKVNRKLEPELVEWLESQSNIQAYVKNLIREDMAKHQK